MKLIKALRSSSQSTQRKSVGLFKALLASAATALCCMGNEMPAKAHHVNPHIDDWLGNYCFREFDVHTCTCIEYSVMNGGDGSLCGVPRVRTTPVYNPWVNPYKDSIIQPPRITF